MVKNIFKKVLRRNKKKRGGEINPEDIFVDSSNLAGLDMDKQEGAFGRSISQFMHFLPVFILIIVLTVFIYRLYILQVKNYSFYKEKSDNNRYNSTLIIANRGEIFDRNGKILAQNIISSTTEVLKRRYIEDVGFSNLLGYVTYPKADSLNNYWQDKYIGKDGVELEYQDLLTGVNGKKILEKDVNSSIESQNIIIKPVPGVNLNLTIDAVLQNKLYESIRNVVNTRGFVSGAGVIMDVTNGEILAITSFPEYDNNLMTNATGSVDRKIITESLKDKRTPFLNRAIAGLFVPGSVVKPFMAYAALNEGIISPEKQILSTGKIVIPNVYGGPDSVFRDWKVHGWINVVRALAESSDEYFYQVGGGYQGQSGLGISKIDEYAKLFGLSTSTSIDLPGEETGVIPTPEWKRINFTDPEWRLGDTYHTSIGQYGFQLTPIELVRYIAAIANGGNLVTPHVFLSASSTIYDKQIEATNIVNSKVWSVVDLDLNQSALKYVKEGMRAVVLPSGTVEQLNIPGLNVAAKSGTAEIGLVKGRVNSLMTGYFPYDNPKYAFTVVVENGPVGGTSAGAQAIKPILEYISENLDEFIKE